MLFIGLFLIVIGVIIACLRFVIGLPETWYSEIFGIRYTTIIGGFLIIVGLLFVLKSYKNR